MEREVKEYILCASVYYDDKKTREGQPENITSGIVISAWRHAQCYQIIYELFGGLFSDNLTAGFLTNKNRFVDRKEGAEIAFAAGQTQRDTKRLQSEDLY
jgi:hypothetical protein